jgi:hypothetical protein
MDEQLLRRSVLIANARRDTAIIENVTADNNGWPRPHSDADLASLRLDVDVAAYEARAAGVNIDDLVGRNVGRLEGGS